MEGFTILDSENIAPISDNPKVGRVIKGSTGLAARKKLADISNLQKQQQQQPRKVIQDEKSRYSSSTTKEYIEQLQKENMALMKMLADRNKIIELTGNELQKLRVNLQKMQQQNLQLAQSNSQMLAELNSGKDRLKALQHEIGCKNGLLKAKMLEEEEKLKLKACQTLKNEVKSTKGDDPGESTMEVRDVDKQNHIKRRPHSESLGPSRQVQAKDKAGNKRACLRRQSARFKSEELESREDLFEIDDTKLSVHPPATDSVLEENSTSTSVVVKDEDKEGNVATSHNPLESGRTSIGRPSRQAAMKVQSYKEIPLNMKMRRPK